MACQQIGGVKMGLESSGSEKTIHALNVDDILLDKRDREQPRGEGGAGRGDWSIISGKSTGGNSPQPPLKRINVEPSSKKPERKPRLKVC